MKSHITTALCLAVLLSTPGIGRATAQQETTAPVTKPANETAEEADSLYNQLEEFVIVTQKELIKSDGEKLSYDLEQDETSKGLSVLDALRKVPMVSVDGQDNIRIKGDTNFRIYVNGKEEPMLTANASQILKAMPAEAVSKIEVITEPGARYDAEGTGGILNLITERKQRKDGYTASISLNAGSSNEGASGYARVKYGKITADANVNYFDNLFTAKAGHNTQERKVFEPGNSYRSLMEMSQKFKFNYVGGGLNLSWEPDSRNLFTISGNFNCMNADITKLKMYNSVFDSNGGLTSAYMQDGFGNMNNLSVSGNGSYRHSFNEQGSNLIVSYAFNYGKNIFDIGYENESILNAPLMSGAEENKSDTYNREHTATIDYVNPFDGGKHTLETGVKGIFRRNAANSCRYSGPAKPDMSITDGSRSLTDQLQDVYAAYATYAATFGKVALKAGLRYEHTWMGMDFLTGEGMNFRKNLDDVVPNAALTYMFGPATNLRLAYQMRISRPNLSQMNPFKFQIYQGEIRTGNPDLDSERYHNITLTYSNYGRVLSGNISLEAFTSDNTIENYKYYEDDVLYDTYANMGFKRRIGTRGFLNWNVTNSMSLSVNGGVHYTTIRSGRSHLSNHGWNADYGVNFSYTGPAKIKYGLYGGQSTGDINLQGKWYGWYYYGIGISRSFLRDEALTVALNASNFLTKYSFYKSLTYTENMRETNVGKNANWNVGISISWKFGHLSDQVKKTGANIENNDMKDTDKNSGGGGFGL